MRFPQLFSRRTSFFANTALLLGGSGLSQIILAVTAPLLTRIYNPAEFGIYAVLLALANFGAAVAGLRYETALLLPKSTRTAASLAALSLTLVTALSVIGGVVGGLLWWGMGNLHGTHFAPGLAFLLPFSITALGVQQVLRAWLMRIHKFGAVTLILVVQSAATVALQIAVGLAGHNDAFSLVAASLVGSVVGSLAALPALRGEGLARRWAQVSSRRIRGVARHYQRFARYTTPYGLVAQISQRGPILILISLATADAAGAFALAQRIVYLPAGMMVYALSQSFYRHAAGRMNDPDVHALVRRVLYVSMLAIGPAFIIAGFNMERLFGIVFGAEWAMAGRFGAWLTVAAFSALLTFWLDRVYDITGQQRLALILEVSLNFISLSIFGLVLYLTKNAEWSVAALTVTVVLYNIIYLAITLHIAQIPWRLFYETVFAAFGVGLYGALVHYGARSLAGYDAAYWVLVTILAVPPMVAGILIATGRIALPPLHRADGAASGLRMEQLGP